MAVLSADQLKAKFETGDRPTAADFIDLIDSFLLADQANFPDPLPAVGGQNLRNLPTGGGTGTDAVEFTPLDQPVSYLSSLSFALPGNLVGLFPENRRIKLDLSPTPMTTAVDSANYSAGTDKTTVYLLDAMPNTTIAKVHLGLVTPLAVGGSVGQQTVGFTRGSDLDAAATLEIGASHFSFDVTATGTNISAISKRRPGETVRLYFKGTVTLINGTALALAGGSNFTTQAGDVLEFEANALGWRQIASFTQLDPDLKAIAALDATRGLLRKTAADSWMIDQGHIGGIVFVAMQSPPYGHLKCNGATVSRATYAELFSAIGTAFGAGDGSTTFKLPDLRGEFLRGWDDSRGIDSGRGFGSAQTESLASHQHVVNANTLVYVTSGGTGAYTAGTAVAAALVSGNNATSSTGGTETRPRNIALLACIRFL